MSLALLLAAPIGSWQPGEGCNNNGFKECSKGYSCKCAAAPHDDACKCMPDMIVCYDSGLDFCFVSSGSTPFCLIEKCVIGGCACSDVCDPCWLPAPSPPPPPPPPFPPRPPSPPPLSPEANDIYVDFPRRAPLPSVRFLDNVVQVGVREWFHGHTQHCGGVYLSFQSSGLARLSESRFGGHEIQVEEGARGDPRRQAIGWHCR